MALDIEKYKKKLKESKERSAGSGDKTFFNIKEGRNVVRILPAREGSEDIYSECFINYNLGPEQNKQAVSRSKAGLSDDPVKDYIAELKASGDEDDAKLAKRLNPRLKYYFNVIDRSLEKGDEHYGEVMVMGCGVTVFEGILSLICDPDYGDITDPKEGYDVIITRTGKGMKTEYAITARPKQTAIGVKDWKSKLHDLETLVNPRSAEDIEYLLENGDWPPRDGDDESSDKKKKKKKKEDKKKKSKKKKKEVEEELEDDELDEDEIEEDEIDDEDFDDEDLEDTDDDEDEDEDDEDEDEDDDDEDEDEDEDDEDIESEIAALLEEEDTKKKKTKKKKKSK